MLKDMYDRPKYHPTKEDIQWATHALTTGELIQLPLSRLLYRVDHANKRIILVNPSFLLNNQENLNDHMATIDVFAAVGYIVIEAE